MNSKSYNSRKQIFLLATLMLLMANVSYSETYCDPTDEGCILVIENKIYHDTDSIDNVYAAKADADLGNTLEGYGVHI